MRLYSAKITPLSEELVKALIDAGDIETEDPPEVIRDVESVLSNYLAMEREVTEKAKDLLTARGLPPSELARAKRAAAEQKGIKVGDEMFDFLLDQLIEILMHSNNVEEVYGQDHDLRRRMRPIMRKYLEIDDALDQEVRGRLKHVKEGTRDWEIEYRRMMDEIKGRKGLA